MVADISLVINNIKTVFCRSWCQKASTWIETLLYITKISTIEEYLIIYADFDNLTN